jgi:hypothetical protein
MRTTYSKRKGYLKDGIAVLNTKNNIARQITLTISLLILFRRVDIKNGEFIKVQLIIFHNNQRFIPPILKIFAGIVFSGKTL